MYTVSTIHRIRKKSRHLQNLSAISDMDCKGVQDEVHPKELQKLLSRVAGFTGRGTDQSFDPAFHETGEVFDRMYRTFRTGSEVLHAFHFSDPSVSGSADSPDHQGKSAWQIKCRADRTLSGDPAGSGRTFQ